MAKQQEETLYDRIFDKETKARCFDELAALFYNKNFGHLTKSHIDLKMFSIYLERLLDKKQNFDDYTMAKQLGILPAKVRQLKKQKQLIYPRKYEWQTAFMEYAKNARWDHGDKVAIMIPDPNVQMELEYYLESHGGYAETQLNAKLLKIPVGVFLQLMMDINGLGEEEKNKYRKDLSKELRSQYKEDEWLIRQIEEGNCWERMPKKFLPVVVDVLGAGADIAGEFGPGSVIKDIVVSLIKKLL